jgi:colanic acid/amylovoran biosynthesis protein
MKKKILLVNALPLNNGDAALIFSAYNYFIKEGYDVKVATHKYEYVKQYYPENDWVKDLNDIKFLWKIPFFKAFITPFKFLLNKHYRNADVIAGVPGGYLNSYYGILSNLVPFFIAKLFGKTTILLPQSFGPIKGKDRFIFKFFAKFIDVLISRDNFSSSELRNLNIDSKQFFQMPDLAFYNASPRVVTKERIAAVSVRRWNHDNRDSDLYEKLIIQFVNILVEKGYRVEFISTCQGLNEYIDDSELASEIFDKLASEVKNKVSVIENYFKYPDFFEYISKYELVVGTRLHMCILAMCHGIPTFNISYEKKGIECYNYLNIPELSVDYNNDLLLAKNKFEHFINEKERYKKKIDIEVMRVKNEIVLKLSKLKKTIN